MHDCYFDNVTLLVTQQALIEDLEPVDPASFTMGLMPDLVQEEIHDIAAEMADDTDSYNLDYPVSIE